MTIPLYDLQKVSRVHVVDNSKLALDGNVYKRMPRIIHCYKKNNNLTRTRLMAGLGDKVLLAIKGQMKKAIIVGCKQRIRKPNVPQFDSNNVVLIDDDGNPVGTRILAPIPAFFRTRGDLAKIAAIATTFV
jgi:large subunit ribosomal protein L14